MKHVLTWPGLALVGVALTISTAAVAHDVSEADQMLCAAMIGMACEADGVCEDGTPEDWNIPPFLVVDTATKTLSTLEASDDERSTPMRHLERTNGTIVMQGTEAGRAFSLVIDEESGRMTASVAGEGISVTVFGMCTPLPVEPARDD